MSQFPFEPFSILQEARRIVFQECGDNVFSLGGNFDCDPSLAIGSEHYFDAPQGIAIIRHNSDVYRGKETTDVTMIDLAKNNGIAVCLETKKKRFLSDTEILDARTLQAQRLRCYRLNSGQKIS